MNDKEQFAENAKTIKFKERNCIAELRKALPKRPVIRIKPVKGEPSYVSSKIGGSFYWPNNCPPEEMYLLAQFNLSELPHNKMFPRHGMLQFFVKKDDLYGLQEENGSLVVYHPEILENGSEIRTEEEDDDSPVMRPCGVSFEAGEEYMSKEDYRFESYCSADEEYCEECWNTFDGWGTKLGGFPSFCQGDPRWGTESRYDTLLFQLDSEPNYVMWGDSGIANFFIPASAMKNMQFSDFFFTWDCY